VDNQPVTVLPEVLYGDGDFEQRSAALEREFRLHFKDSPRVWCSAPGRTELGGNHTDHQHGRVLAAAVHVDALAAAAPTGNDVVTIHSAGHPEAIVVSLADLAPRPEEKETSAALVRGVASRLAERGHTVSGFHATVDSAVKVGSGLSSSAAFEILIGTIFNHLFNHGTISPRDLALVGQFAENHFFGKPCGLMDQMTSAVGGAISIDFKDPDKPLVENVPFDPAAWGYTLCVVHTGGSHADLTQEYAAIPAEMKAVARLFGHEVCRGLRVEELVAEATRVRASAGDRAYLRALHFLEENQRVLLQADALRRNDAETFLGLVRESGDSSIRLLQNIYAPGTSREQGVALALAMTQKTLHEIGNGACRVHGGGFAGTIQAYLPHDAFAGYANALERIFGEGSVFPLTVRHAGAVALKR
jgi:galactokinase